MSVKHENSFNEVMQRTISIRSLTLFHSAINAEATRLLYDRQLAKFQEYYKISNPNELIRLDQKELQVMIEDYIIYLSGKGLSRGTVKTAYNSLLLFFSMNDIILNWKKFRKMFPAKTKPRGQKPYTTDQMKEILKICSSSPKYTALIHFLSASGVRDGFTLELKVKHLADMPNGCKAVKIYESDISEYTTFIHQEAVKALENYFAYRKAQGEIITPDSWVFASTTRQNTNDPSRAWKPIDISSALNRKLANKIDRGEKARGRYDIPITYGIRKRWNTIVKSNDKVNLSHAEKMFGHSTTIPLDNHYHKPELEVLFAEYEKHISELMIDDSFRLRQELEIKNKLLSEFELKEIEVRSLKTRLSEIEAHLKNFTT